jgi:mono/diheme cytochrome c family protein
MKQQLCYSRWLAMRPLMVLAFAAVMCAGMFTSSPADAEEQVGNAQRGKQLFVSNGCFACHGYNGQGGSYTGPKIAPDPLPWQAIAAFIRFPRGVTPPYTSWPFNVMPPFTAQLVPDKDVQDIYAYLKSIPGPTDLKNVPTFTK